MKTAQQIENLKDALVWWQTVPEVNVSPDLRNWAEDESDKTTCGTVACFGGWCARWPALRKQGLKMDSEGFPLLSKHGELGIGAAKHLFGDIDLWMMRGDHPADEGFKGTDHALVTNRIRWALKKA